VNAQASCDRTGNEPRSAILSEWLILCLSIHMPDLEICVTDSHFCTCTDRECPLNPNNSNCKHRSCDRCIRKCLKAGEIPSCFFKDIHADTSGNTDYTYRGFATYLDRYGKSADEA
jgi:hypothetical protein